MEKIENMIGKRLFSLNFYKDLKLPLGKMSLTKDFVNETRGDIYPVIESSDGLCEKVSGGKYSVNGEVTRLIGRHIPYCTYEMTFDSLNGAGGFSFILPDEKIFAGLKNDGKKLSLVFFDGSKKETFETDLAFAKGTSLLVTARKKNLDCYIKTNGFPQYFCTFCSDSFENIEYSKVFEKCSSCVSILGEGVLSDASFYIDCGISQADIRPIRYENGEILIENGKVFLTASIRMQAECYQGIFAWVPGTADFQLVGALFYDAGDGMWGNDVAASMMYDRNEKVWKLWVCSFSHGHILGHARFESDVRFGVNLLDISLMEKMEDGDENSFLSKMSDEDPDFIYDEKSGKWYMSICRAVTGHDSREYHYFFFESDNAFSGYRFIGRTSCGGAETGGSLLMIDGRLIFACGACFDKRAEYRIYDLFDVDHCTRMRFDYDDGGFRGWGTIIPIKYGNRERFFHLTFDRAGGSDYTWSYGNIYCFELLEE
ncbi:MAG: hypothetical protein E7656_01095 [Ruminococcaceae bacterium]|nr:hypothetical protein [Oscillospiraceae bacterium]